MKISKGNKIIMGMAGIGLAILLFMSYLILSDTEPAPALDSTGLYSTAGRDLAAGAGGNAENGKPSAPDAAAPANSAIPGDRILEDKIVLELQTNYGKTISQKRTQAALFEVRNYIFSLFPGEDGRAKFHQILRQAFPEFADEIMNTLDLLDEYNQWMADNDRDLSQMSDYERTLALWEKRKALFGEDAEEIWEGELLATEARKQTMKDTLNVLEQSYDTSIDEKLEVFKTTLQQTYENTPDEYLLDHKDLAVMAFFSINSVQDALKQMTPEERQQEMNNIRRELGFSQDEIERMAEIDAEREKGWEIGRNYMAERETVLSRYEGEERKAQLKALREKYFKEEANTIALEEENDLFFRFLRPRYYGRN